MAGVSMTTIDRDLGLGHVVQSMKELGKDLRVDVGIFDGEIATYAAYNEFGTGTIPARPFMRTAFDENRPEYEDMARVGIANILNKRGSVATLMTRMGMKAVKHIKRKITSIRTPPNAPRTVARKGVNNPLIETGTMRNAVTYEVRK